MQAEIVVKYVGNGRLCKNISGNILLFGFCHSVKDGL